MVLKKPQKTPTYKFFCKPCSFRCNNKKDFNRHLNTTKHKNGINGVNGINYTEEEILKCDICDKIYKHKSGLYRHKKTCKNTPSVLSKIIQNYPKWITIIHSCPKCPFFGQLFFLLKKKFMVTNLYKHF